ncbi:hypothetical protein PR003_g8376 [Phytophthora rubi]|uniref:Uncharacterized protein n=1 Tax=Phytophthora rubi TaxID=129364 RepID=A0A6A4FBC5_9STRA|nr:hypothetical protein PR003_g8376 [Phytophthora rubi]
MQVQEVLPAKSVFATHLEVEMDLTIQKYKDMIGQKEAGDNNTTGGKRPVLYLAT